eukprot:COSAG01_NODE_71593_length_255_cov_0.980769_1_plen_56_part_10
MLVRHPERHSIWLPWSCTVLIRKRYVENAKRLDVSGINIIGLRFFYERRPLVLRQN